MSSWRARVLRLLLFALCPLPAGSLAQTTGDIEGRVTDPSGGGLAGATVTATSPNLQGTRVTLTDINGFFRIPAVPPGAYLVRGTLPGFRPAEMTATVPLDGTGSVALSLEASATAEVTVNAQAPLLDATSTTGGTTYTSRVVARLPVSRNYADIVHSNPGVNTDQGETQGRSLALTIYGSTSAENQWIVDGINTTNVIKGFQGKAINTEFVQEVEVKTGGYQAEYGRSTGGVINVITKSGGNAFHGDAFVYYNDYNSQASEVFTAQDTVVNEMRIADYRRTDYGADLGGPIFRDRLWFFAAYDRVDQPGEVTRRTDSLLVPAGMPFPLDSTNELYSGKLTWNIAASSTLVATAFSDPTTNSGAGRADPRQGRFLVRPVLNPDPGTWQADRQIGGTDFGVRFQHLFGSSSILSLQGARHEDRYLLEPVGPGSRVRLEDWTCEGGTPVQPCYAPTANFVEGGLGGVFGPVNNNESRRDQYRLDVNAYLSNHEVKIGADYLDSVTRSIDYFTGGQLVRRYNEFGETYYEHRFYTASPTSLAPIDNVSEPQSREVGLYVQDSWRLSSNLTLNVGLRWDQQDTRDYRGISVIKTTNEWQPRIGVVWDPRSDGTTKLYAFAGRFYYSLPTDAAVRSFGDATIFFTHNFDPISLTPDEDAPWETFNSGGPFGTPVDSGIRGIYQDELTVGFERLLDPSFTMGLKATYRDLGRTIEDRCDLDYTEPESNNSSCALYNPGSEGPFARGDFYYCNGLDYPYNNCTFDPETHEPLFGAPPIPAAKRVYKGIELLARKSFGERTWMQASYLYSSLRGNYDGAVSGEGQTDPGINADFDYPQMLQNADGRLYLDRPHSFRLDGYHTTSFGLFVGLQGYVRSGAPTSRLGYLDAQGYQVYLVRKGYEGRMPTDWEASLTVGYPFAVGPVTITAQVYVFNLFNNQTPTDRDNTWSVEAPPDYPDSLFDPNQPQSNPEYGKVTGRQDPRLLRAALRISF
jgi:outer membrane receptor protein involved in Fe transport